MMKLISWLNSILVPRAFEVVREVSDVTPDVENVKWFRISNSAFYVCLVCGKEWNNGVLNSNDWPSSIKRFSDKECNRHDAHSKEQALIQTVDLNGKYFIVSQEKCKLCGGIHCDSSRGRNNRLKCPKCNNLLGVMYDKIGYASDRLLYLFKRK